MTISMTNNLTIKLIKTMLLAILTLSIFPLIQTFAFEKKTYIASVKEEGDFTLVASGKSAPLLVSSKDFPGVVRISKHLQRDIESVAGVRPEVFVDSIPATSEIVIIGTLGRNVIIDKLVKEKKLNVDDIFGKWEASIIQIVEKPFPNIDRALVIVGSDKRGTIFGIYDLSENIGVSPWYWWADVPVKNKNNIFVKSGRYTYGEPKVKYRGIFINDEAPALTGLVFEKFGGFKSKFYEHVFELILRLKGNFLWPAMWGRAFYDDDPENPRLADEYGVVISTSHHEPMMRAHDEWRRYGKGPWNYEKNDSTLKTFWTEGIRRMSGYESVVTLAMRGDGDEAMSPTANVELLQRIVEDQRKIIVDVTQKDLTTVPQVWALYKEVQEYYDKGMRVPDDVTVLLCDDNWGNIRKLPRLDEPPRQGGYGIYYHYDFVGGPRNYKWLNTNQIERVWEQMHLAYEYNARQIWIVNVGDIKPMEFPIEFFLDYAWNPESITASDLPEYSRRWAEEQFGPEYSLDIAEILDLYTKYNSRRKPEMLSPDTYSLINYREAETVVAEYNILVQKAQRINNLLPVEYKDAFYQLVLHQPEACANLNNLYVTAGKNHLYAKQGRAATNIIAQRAKELFKKDSLITHYYNNVMANGKWSHMMDQTHIGYTSWQQPDRNIMPEIKEIQIPDAAEMGIAIEGSDKWWPHEKNEAVLPTFDATNQPNYYLEVFNRGKSAFQFSAKSYKPWIKVNPKVGKVETEQRLWVSVDWKKAPKGKYQVPITLTGPNKSRVVVQAIINNQVNPKREQLDGFIESNGYVSIEADNYSNAVSASSVSWQKIPNLGRTSSAMTPIPVTVVPQKPNENSPRLEYKVYLFSSGEVNVKTYLSPTLNFLGGQGLQYAISFDDEMPQILNMHEGNVSQDWKYPQWWNQMVSDNAKIVTSKHNIQRSGEHILKFWMVDPAVVLQKIVVEIIPDNMKKGDIKSGYLGPPQSRRIISSKVERK